MRRLSRPLGGTQALGLRQKSATPRRRHPSRALLTGIVQSRSGIGQPEPRPATIDRLARHRSLAKPAPMLALANNPRGGLAGCRRPLLHIAQVPQFQPCQSIPRPTHTRATKGNTLMAEATKRKQARPAKRKPAPRKPQRASGPKRKPAGSKTAKTAASKAKANAPRPDQTGVAPIDAAGNAALAGKAALAGTQAAGQALRLAAARVKVPLAAGGGLAAGAVGGLTVLRRRRRRSRRGGFDVASAAERVGAIGEEIGRVASVIQNAAGDSKRSR
jgi:hypothetical protein